MEVRKGGIWRRVVLASVILLALTAAVLTVALDAQAGSRADARELAQRMVPAAAASVDLLALYQAQQNWLHDYVTAGHPGPLTTFDGESAQIQGTQDQIAALVRGHAPIMKQLDATTGAYQAWLDDIAGPQLAIMAQGDVTLAQELQADTAGVRPVILSIRSYGAALQAQIAAVQQSVTSSLSQEQATVLYALVAMCIVAVAIAADRIVAVWFGLVRPSRAMRAATDAVAAGDYGTQIPVGGPAELADLARGIELMRTELVKALAARERALTSRGRAEQRFRGLFDGAPDPMIAVAPDGSIAMANARAGRLFGCATAELIGREVGTLVPEKRREALARERRAYFAAPVSQPAGAEFKMTGLRGDGGEFPAEVTLSALPLGRGMLVTAAIRDVSERRALDAERERLRAAAEQERFEGRVRQFQRLESLGQLVGGVAHDFNNLLNVIEGYTEFALKQVTAVAREDARLEPVLADIGQVRAAAQQAIRVTRQLLTFARHEATTPEIIDLNEAVQDAGQLLRRALGEHIELTIAPEPALWRVTADRGQLEQVLVNLAVNARDAMPGGGQLTIDTGNAGVDDAFASQRPGLRPGRYARLRVSDTGTGMDQATVDRVFEPFFSTKPKGRGTGLGLATVYGIVTGARGTIDIYSEVGIGTTVSVLLPATEERAGPDPASRPVVGDDVRGHGETILLVEDEASMRELTRRILADHGYRVCVADNGADAVRRAEDPAQPVDLLLTDVVMPEMLGNEVAARVAALRPQVPTLFISGYAQPILDRQGVLLPGYDILEKPFTEAALLSRVRTALARTPASADLAGGQVRSRHSSVNRSTGRGGQPLKVTVDLTK
jgi:PAS domain S-box-containing protein